MKLLQNSFSRLLAAVTLCTGLGMAQSTLVCSYNLFALGNVTSQYSDVQGRVAAGGNATYTGYDFGSQLTPDPTRYDVVAGGNLTFTNGQVEKGSVVAGGNIGLTSVTIVGGNVVAGGTVTLTNGTINGTVLQNQVSPLPVNFAHATSFLQNTSLSYGSLTPNGQTVNQWGGLYLTGTNPVLNVFYVPGSVLATVWGVQLTVPSGSTVLINVDGTSDTIPNGGFNYSGVTAAQVLFNFYQATSLTIGGAQGTVLAPFAAVNFPYGVATGTLIVNSLNGNGQINLASFTGQLPPPAGQGTFCNDQAGGTRQ